MTIRPEHRDFASKIMLLKEEAMRIGLYRTGHLLELPIIETGWEMQNAPTPTQQKNRQREVTRNFQL